MVERRQTALLGIAKLLKREEEADLRPATTDGPDDSRSLMLRALAQELTRVRARNVRRRRLTWLLGATAAASVVGIFSLRTKQIALAAVPVDTQVAGSASAPPVQGWSVQVEIDRAGTVLSKGTGGALETGDRIVAPLGGELAVVKTHGVSHLALHPGTTAFVVESGKTTILRADSGTVHAQIAKLGVHERFLVRTAEADIEVRGTRFEVKIDPNLGASHCVGPHTYVHVEEGVVEIRPIASAAGPILLRAGDSWKPTCIVPVPPKPDSTTTVATPTSLSVARPVTSGPVPLPGKASPSAAPSTSVAVAPRSTIGEQNSLYSEAMAAKRRGASGEALEKLDRLLRVYPSSALTESAMAERMRLLGHSTVGQQAAHAYLARFPDGFARDEARTLALGKSR